MIKQVCALGGALFLILQGAAAVSAQVGPDTTRAVLVEGVVVNVLRTPVLVTDAPFAVAANTQEEIQRAGPGLGLDEALSGIPGVQVDDRYNYALGDRISIRGFGARTPFGVRGITVLVDGIPATLPDGTTNLNHVDLGFLRRAEVIRGPASALYGNAAGGVIQFESELAPEGPISEEIGIVAGADGLLRLNSTTGGRSGDSSYLLNVTRLTYDGYREYQDAKNLQLNGSVGTTALGGALRLVGAFVDYDANNPGSLNQAMLDANRFQAAPPNLMNQTGEEGTQGQLGLSWRGALGPGSLDVAMYGLTREIRNPIPGTTVQIDRKAGGVHLLYRSGREGDPPARLSWGVGAEGDLQMDFRENFPHSGGVPSTTANLSQDEEVTGGALFGQVTAGLGRRLMGLAGLRYDVTRFEAEDRLITATNPDESGSRTMSAVSPSIGLTFELSPIASIYGNIATSFETPTMTELANQEGNRGGINPELDPQKTLSFEGGIKGLAGSWAAYQLSAYHARVDDALVQFTPQNERTYFRNAGSAVHRGVELGLLVAPFEAVRADLAYTFTDARFDDYTVGGVSLEDNRIPGVSPHRLDASLTVSGPFGAYVMGEARYSDLIPVNDRNTANAPAYTIFDARAGLDRITLGGIAVAPFIGVTNLFDTDYITSISVNHGPGRFFEPGPGRAAYAGGQVRLGLR